MGASHTRFELSRLPAAARRSHPRELVDAFHFPPCAPSSVWPSVGRLGTLFPPAAAPRVPAAPARPMLVRCIEKGCVFPAHPGSERCLDHERQRLEPALYESSQPTSTLADQAKFGLPDKEVDDSRFRDRRRFASQRRAFLDE